MNQKDSLWDLAVKKAPDSHFGSSGEKTLIFVGTKGSGKSTIIQRFLDKNDVIKETLALEYSFGRKSGRSLTKETCHVWELGGGMLHINLLDIYLGKKNTSLILVLDLTRPETLWKTLEGILTHVYNFHKKSETFDVIGDNPKVSEPHVTPFPMPLVIVGSKYDVFNIMDIEKKKQICRTLRSVAHSLWASLIFYSDKDAVLIKKLKDVLHFHGFGGSQWKGHCSDYNKPLLISAGNDTFEEIGVNVSSLSSSRGLPLESFKHTYTIMFPQVSENTVIPDDPVKDQSFKEPLIDSLRAQMDDELDRFLTERGQRRNLTSLLL